MAVYKVIQDIEAEDKLLGPLTLKQFIFAGVAAAFAYGAFFTATKTANIFWAVPFLPFILVAGVLAAPLGRDQPTDVWLAAQIRFFTKPRKRLWDQSGIKNLVTITAPRREEKHYTNGLSQQEVHSRLRALADTIDSRGWAVKNVAVNMYAAPSYAMAGTDRLIDPASLPQAVPNYDITEADDIMDAANNPVAQHFDQMVNEASRAQKAAAIERMQNAINSPVSKPFTAVGTPKQQNPVMPIDPWFMHQPDPSSAANDGAMFTPLTITPGTPMPDDNNDEETPDEQALLEHIKEEKSLEHQGWAHHKTIPTPEEVAAEEVKKQIEEQLAKEKAEAEARAEAERQQAQAVTAPKDPDIVELANTNDLSVASVAHIAKRKQHAAHDNTEVIVNLR